MYTRQFSFLVIITIVAMVVSAIFPTSVLAEDADPPPDGNTEATAEPAEADTSPTSDDSSESSVALDSTSSGIDVVILDELGQSIPSTSTEGVDALLNGQPVWCPDGVTPDSGGDSCTASFGSISDLLTSVSDDSQDDGTIYVQTEVAEVVVVADMPSADLAADMLQESNAAGVGAIAGLMLQDTNVVVLDDQGEAVPAIGQTAVDALMDGTSVWCPEGVTPETGGDSCTAAVDNIGAMASILGANPQQQEGTVYVQAVVVGDTAPIPTDVETLSEPEAMLFDDSTLNGVVLDGLTQGTDVAVVNELGQETALVDETILEEGIIRDPVWCPDGVTPSPGTNGCTISYASLGQLVSFLTTNQPTQNGTIWIEQGSDSSASPIVINGSVASTWAHYALTLQGGWNGTSGNSAITGQTTFSKSISVTNWLNDVTLNDLTAQNTAGTGITVQTAGDIVLENVSSNANAQNGAWLENCNMVYDAVYGDWYCDGTGTGSVSIIGTNSFSDNHGVMGVGVSSDGDVEMSNLTVSNNDYLGVYINNSDDFSVTGSSTFDNNPGDSILAYSYGDIYVENITVTNSDGIHLDTFGAVTLLNSYFDKNTSQVVFIDTVGDVYISGVTSNNSVSSFGVAVSGARILTEGNITVNCSTFNNNAGYGLEAGYSNWYTVSPNSVTFNGVSFSGNGSGDYLMVGSGALTVNQAYPCGGGGGDDVSVNKGTAGTGTAGKPATSLNVVNLTGPSLDAPQTLDCISNSGTMLVAPLGNSATFACPMIGSVNLIQLENINGLLPGALPVGNEFVSALSAVLFGVGGSAEIITTGVITISFVIPADLLNENLAVLYWDGTSWMDLSTAVFSDGKVVYNKGTKTTDGKFEASTNFTGVYVLVKK